MPESSLPDVVAEAPAREGRVVLNCAIPPNGPLTDCRVVSETPRGAGFGAAALAGAQRARRDPDIAGGDGARVTFTVRFTPPSAEPADR